LKSKKQKRLKKALTSSSSFGIILKKKNKGEKNE